MQVNRFNVTERTSHKNGQYYYYYLFQTRNSYKNKHIKLSGTYVDIDTVFVFGFTDFLKHFYGTLRLRSLWNPG